MTHRFAALTASLLGLLVGASAAIGATVQADGPDSTILTLTVESGDLTGELLKPEGEGPFPAIVIQPGSGPTNRDGNAPGLTNDSLKLLAQALADRGVASVRLDKRGIGDSAGAAIPEIDLRFETFAGDIAAWADAIRERDDVSDVALLGHSEGGHLVTLAAEMTDVSHLVLVSSPGRPAYDLLRDQLEGRLPPELAQESDSILESLIQGETVPNTSPALAALYRDSIQPYLISWFEHDPAEDLARTDIPALVVIGTTDVQVSEADAERLAAAR